MPAKWRVELRAKIGQYRNRCFAEHISDIYRRELQLNKANTSDKETSFFDLNIKVIGNNIHTSVYDKRDDFGFSIVNFPWLSGDVPRLLSYGIYVSRLVRFATCCGEIWFQEYVSKGSTHPVFYGDLIYKLRRVKGDANFISFGSKIVKLPRRRQYDPAIIERTLGLVVGPFAVLCRSFLERCTLTHKAVRTI